MRFVSAALMIALALSLSACGLKGKLLSPTQVANADAKKAQKEKEKAGQQDDVSDSFLDVGGTPATPPVAPAGGK